MSRVAKRISLADFEEKCKNTLMREGRSPDFTPRIDKDLKKIQFDFENFDWEKGEGYGDGLCGICEVAPGLPVWFMSAGGDWEYPVIFIVYWSGKELRGYIPEDGNVFNKKYRTAYGSESDSDLFEKETKGMDIDKYDLVPDDPTEEESTEDKQKIYADIFSRIELRD